MAYTKLLTAAALCALLSACATVPPAPLSAQPVAAFREQIDFSGRLSVNYQRDGKDDSLSGHFNWRQSAAGTDVALSSPLGQTVATISVTPQQATLTESGKPPRVAADIDTLSAQALGWPLPVSGLRQWLQGYADGADGRRFVASPLNDNVTTKDGWHLTYVSWQDPAAGRPPQPKRIDAVRPAVQGAAAVDIRIVLDAGAAL